MLSNQLPDGSDQPKAYASQSLAPNECKYLQLNKHNLAIVFGFKHFHQYLFGRSSRIVSEQKPFENLLNGTKGDPTLVCAHIQRWALTLNAYNTLLSTSLVHLMEMLTG